MRPWWRWLSSKEFPNARARVQADRSRRRQRRRRIRSPFFFFIFSFYSETFPYFENCFLSIHRLPSVRSKVQSGGLLFWLALCTALLARISASLEIFHWQGKTPRDRLDAARGIQRAIVQTSFGTAYGPAENDSLCPTVLDRDSRVRQNFRSFYIASSNQLPCIID